MTRHWISIFLFLFFQLAAIQSAGAFDGKAYFYGFRKPTYIYEVDIATGAKRDVYRGTGNPQSYPCISPDGKMIGYLVEGGKLWVVNIADGSGAHIEIEGFGSGDKHWEWTTNGIFWTQDVSGGVGIMRHIYGTPPSSKTIVHTWKTSDYPDGKVANESYYASRDGLKAWSRVTVTHTGWYKNVTQHFVDFPDTTFSKANVRELCAWGHGQGMTLDGKYVLLNTGFGGPWTVESTFQKDDQFCSHTCWCAFRHSDMHLEFNLKSGGKIQWSATPLRCYNDNDYIGYIEIMKSPESSIRKCFVYNWVTQAPHEMFHEADANEVEFFGFWKGSAQGTTPSISLSPNSVSFEVAGAQPPPAQSITVTNTGAGTLTKVSATANPAASWLTITVQGSGGNNQTISNAVNVTGLSDGTHTTTVTVSGGGAPNQQQYVVTVTKNILVPPQSVSTELVGSELQDVSLSWQLSASATNGYLIERKSGSGAWQAVTSVAKGTTSYQDKNLPLGTYQYRMASIGANDTSTYSSESTIQVTGAVFIKDVKLPNDTLRAGTTANITWTSNRIGQVKILVSKDGGVFYDEITATGGIIPTDDNWEDYPWQVPLDLAGKTVLLKVSEYTNNDPSAISGPVYITPPSGTASMPDRKNRSPGFTVKTGAKGVSITRGSAFAPFAASLIDARGKVVAVQSARGTSGSSIMFEPVPSGMYYLRITGIDGRNSIDRIMIP